MRYSMVPTTPEHVAYVAERMRQADVDEVRASANLGPLEALEVSVRVSDPALTGLLDGEPVCIFGVASRSLLSDAGVPWMLGTGGVERHAAGFLRRSRKVVAGWLDRFDTLENFVDSRNTKSIAWLRWLGFTIHPPQPHGPFKVPFHHFTMTRGTNV